MPPLPRLLLAAALALPLAACNGSGAKRDDPNKVAEIAEIETSLRGAAARAAIADAAPVSVAGRAFEAGVFPDRLYALVRPTPPRQELMSAYQEAAAARSGCKPDARRNGSYRRTPDKVLIKSGAARKSDGWVRVALLCGDPIALKAQAARAEKREKRKAARAADIAARKAAQAAARPVFVNGESWLYGVYENDPTLVQLRPDPPEKTTKGAYVAAARAASGCNAAPTGMTGQIPDRATIGAKGGGAAWLEMRIDCPTGDARSPAFPDYPQGGWTWLSFSRPHGFQVNYLAADGTAWLWYPGNERGVPELWRVDAGRDAICWTHPKNSWNPAAKTRGGRESCEPAISGRGRIIARLKGDPYRLASGNVPYPLPKCEAPKAFEFDRARHSC